MVHSVGSLIGVSASARLYMSIVTIYSYVYWLSIWIGDVSTSIVYSLNIKYRKSLFSGIVATALMRCLIIALCRQRIIRYTFDGLVAFTPMATGLWRSSQKSYITEMRLSWWPTKVGTLWPIVILSSATQIWIGECHWFTVGWWTCDINVTTRHFMTRVVITVKSEMIVSLSFCDIYFRIGAGRDIIWASWTLRCIALIASRYVTSSIIISVVVTVVTLARPIILHWGVGKAC